MEKNDTKDRPALFFIGVLLLLVGLYGSFTTLVNILAFEKYPQHSIFSLSGNGGEYGSPQSEADCTASYYYQAPTYYEGDSNVMREPTPQEVKDEAAYEARLKGDEQNCISRVELSRKETMVTDISQSAIFLLLAFGVLVYGRTFRKGILTLKI